jgi:hypothetical protein
MLLRINLRSHGHENLDDDAVTRKHPTRSANYSRGPLLMSRTTSALAMHSGSHISIHLPSINSFQQPVF